MMTKRLLSISAAVLMVMAAVSARAADGKLDVVVSIKPMHALVAGVMQGVATPHLLLNDQQSPHHFALKPSQARLLQQADLVFWVDSSLETPMPALLAVLAPHAKNIRFMADTGLVRYKSANRDGADGDDHDDQNEQDDHDDHEGDEDHDSHDGHEDHEDHDGHDGHDWAHRVNPHIWLDLDNARRMVWSIAATLSAVDREHAAIYASNAANLDKRLSALCEEARQQFAGIRRNSFIVQHDAFIYIERQFDLPRGLVIAPDHDTPPGTAHLQHLRDLVAAAVVSCIFDEPQGASHQIDIVTGESTVRRATLDAIGVGRPAEPDLFFDMMRANYSAFAACLAGTP
jgi:zinc transport system substrate-binding protein